MAEARLNGRKALVTGGASGLGQAIAEAFAAEGATVTVADINGDAAKDIAEKIGGKHWQVDLADTEALDALNLNFDILVNNAGIQHIDALEEVFLGHSAVPRLPEADEVAQLAVFLASDAAGVITGSAHSIDGGWSAA